MLWQQQYDILYTLSPCLKTCAKETGMARSDYDIINLSLEHELNEWLQREVMPDWWITGIAWQKLLPANCRTAFI